MPGPANRSGTLDEGIVVNVILRSAVLAIGAAATIATGATPASAAPGAVAFLGTATIDCFGCGLSQGTADLAVLGVVNGGAASGAAHAVYTVTPTGNCLVSGVAEGTVTGAVNVAFTWVRVGAVAVISTAGDINGTGVGTFVITDPIGVPCGARNVRAIVSGTVIGA
jgi:hypothetical protein